MPPPQPQPEPLSDSQKDGLRHLAANAAHHAYAPYSNFRVGAALLLTSGEIVTAANVENCSYRLTCCAEQAAIARAVAQHGPAIRLAAVAIANLAEFGPDAIPILYPGPNGSPHETTLGQLLPAAFRPSSLTPKP